MDNADLNSKWQNILNANKNRGFKSLRISSGCIPDLFLGIDNNKNRCLLLFLPNQIDIKLKKSQKEKLQIEFIKSKNIILIMLTDTNFNDLFDDLIISLFSEIENLSDPVDYSKRLIAQYYKWSAFFEDKHNSKLSFEEIQGLWGELQILKELIENKSIGHINYLLDSWRGPYDKSNDFVFEDKNLEIKTKDEFHTHIRISSEFQLEREYSKGLELVVLTLKQDLGKGKSLHELIKEIVELIWDGLGDLSIFYHALLQKSLTVENSSEYDNYRFCLLSKQRFDCAGEEFPKLIRSNIPPEINNLKYKLQTTSLNDFLLEDKIY
jgi:hypothetical protein